MMVPTRASWQPTTFGIDDHEVVWTQTTEDDCFEQSLRWQWLIPCILQLHPTKLMGWPTGMMSSLSEGWTIWWYDRMSFNSRFDYSIIHACDHSIIQWFYHLIIRLCCIWLFDHSIIWSLDHSIIKSSTIRSSDWLSGCSIIWSFKHSIIWSLDHSIIRSLDPLKADYSRLELTVANWL